MVMDASQPQQPSPQSVGREFVRQYYTLLNKAPNHLHRFYNNNSSFIHDESTLIVGQKNIHNRIQQLNFHDCHAKISQVDSQATLGNGVVVQVTGELSNDGQPMRRFTQTFVLAAQSPKKYYVHNDIFRYQDMYADEETEGESRSENGDEHENPIDAGVVADNQSQLGGNMMIEQQPLQQQQQQMPAQVVATGGGVMPQPQAGAPQQQQTIYYPIPPTGGRPMAVMAPQTAGIPLGAQYATASAGGMQQVQAPPVSQMNGVVGHEELMTGMQQPNAGQQPLVAQTVSPVMQPATSVPLAAPMHAGVQPVAGVASVPVVSNVAISQNAAGVIPGYQQSQMIHQQQYQHQQQQPLVNTAAPQQALLQPQPMHGSETNLAIDENINSVNASSISTSTCDNMTNAPSAVAAPEPAASPIIVDEVKTIHEWQQLEKTEAAKHQQSEPKTYANLFKSTSSSPSGFVNAAMQQQQQIQNQQSANSLQNNSSIPTTTYSQSTSSGASMSTYNNRNNDNSMSVRMDNNNMGSGSQNSGMQQRNNSGRMKDYSTDYDQQRHASNFRDSQQLFLGNIPHHASEDDLRKIFERFGTVVELRILSKPGAKMPPGARNPLNYGFITYEDAEGVQTCLSNCPIFYPENSPDGQKLNVEEKKPRMRNDMPPRQSMGSNMNSQRNMGGGPPSRSLSNSGGGNMMRGGNASGGGNMPRNSGSGSRMGGAGGGGFGRNDNRGGPSNSGGPQMRGGNNNSQSGGGNYGGGRR